MNPYRHPNGRYAPKPNATARAIHYCITNWHFCRCRRLAACNDEGPGDEPVAA
jgi:hypothetical protein